MNQIIVTNPATGKIHKKYKLMSEKDVDGIIYTMDKVRQEWDKTAISERAQCLMNTAKILRKDAQSYAEIISETQ